MAQPSHPGPTLLDWIVQRWWASWRRRLIAVLVGGLALWSISFAERSYYAGEVKLVYVEQPGLLAAELLTRDPLASSLQSLGLTGGGVGPRLPEMLRSRSLLGELLRQEVEFEGERIPAFQAYEGMTSATEEDFDEALDRFRKRRFNATYDARTDVVRLSLLAPTPSLAAQLANDLATRLNERLVRNATERARRQKAFIEERLGQVKSALDSAEVALREFREENRAIQDSPNLRLQEGRLLRDVLHDEQVYATLLAQYELARIEEVKNLPVIDVLDEATAPHRRAKPRRTFRLAAGLALAALVLVVTDAATYLRAAGSEEV